MYEYKYVPVEREGWIFAGFQGYREVIDRRWLAVRELDAPGCHQRRYDPDRPDF